MAKYSFQTKKEIVMAYLNSNKSYNEIAASYKIPSSTVIKGWVHSYQELGDQALMRSRINQNYSFEFKLHVVEFYLSSEVSYQELALIQGINNPALLAKWVNDFRMAGPDALRPKKKGIRKSMNLDNKKSQVESISDTPLVDTSTAHIKQLEDELLKLRIENAYLKELRRLRLEEETLLKKQRESSTASEETSN